VKSKIHYIDPELAAMAETISHSLIGGSVAKQYMSCPGSVRLRAAFGPSPSSSAAAEGTRLHALVEHCLDRAEFSADEYAGFVFENGDSAYLPENPNAITREHVHAVNVGLAHVNALMGSDPAAELYVETRFNLADIDARAFGTADVIVLTSDAMHVVDFKFGKGVGVEVQENPQLMFYAAGARRAIEGAGERFRVVLHVVQPRLAPMHADGPVRSWETDMLALLDFEAQLADAIKATDDPAAPFKAGDHCRFCPGAQIGASGRYNCDAFEAKKNAAADDAFSVIKDPVSLAAMNADELGRRMAELTILAKYIKDFSTFAKAKAREEIPTGFAWAPGGRNWKWNKPDAEVLKFVRTLNGDEAADALAKLVTPIQAAEALDKSTFAEISAFVDKDTAAPQLVKKGARKVEMSLADVQAFFARNKDAAFQEFE
jgi:hypothetical protein